MYEVFEVKSEQMEVVDDILSDDLISRQNTDVKEGESLGFKQDITYVMVEGDEKAVEKAKEMFEENDVGVAENKEKVREKIKEEEEAAAEGVGTVFG